MLLQLHPPHPHPVIQLPFGFKDLEHGLPNPHSWTAQLSNLMHGELDLPKTLHSLDKGVGITSLLEQVTFDLPSLTVSCRFVDGAIEEWPIITPGHVKSLQDIMSDVKLATAEDDRQRERMMEKEKERDVASQRSPSSSVRVGRTHKKQRSLFMSIVTAVGSIINPPFSSRTPSPPPFTTPFSKCSSRLGRVFRHRARSLLVDTYRRYVLMELARRFPRGGYYTWILHSMLRRTVEGMDHLIQEASSRTPDLIRPRGSDAEYFSATTMVVPSLFSDDEEDETDTDGSSLHTPASSHFENGHPVESSAERRLSKQLDMMRNRLCPEDYADYTRYSDLKKRLQDLLIQANVQVRAIEEEQAHREAVLEIRSRRRAWTSKALAGASSSQFGLGMPFKSSRLGQASWSSDDYEFEMPTVNWERHNVHIEQELEEQDELHGFSPRRKKISSTSRLFPVSEEVEGEDGFQLDEALDEHDALQELDLEMGFGASLGCRRIDDDYDPEAGIRVAFEIERPVLRPRIRTSSMYRQRLAVRDTAEISVVPLPRPQLLTSSSILCQPMASIKDDLSGKSHLRPELDVTVDEFELSGYGQFGGYAPEQEFTLAMDLPPKKWKQNRDTILRNRQGLDPFDSAAIECR